VSVVISTVIIVSAHNSTQAIASSKSPESRRIDEMANVVEKQPVAQLQLKNFLLQIDESCLRDNEALL
jgi:hypothetical protein